MKVLYFAQAAQLAGCREEDWDISQSLSLAEFWEEALRRHPELTSIRSHCRVASGGEYVAAGGRLDWNQEAAVIPPVSGG